MLDGVAYNTTWGALKQANLDAVPAVALEAIAQDIQAVAEARQAVDEQAANAAVSEEIALGAADLARDSESEAKRAASDAQTEAERAADKANVADNASLQALLQAARAVEAMLQAQIASQAALAANPIYDSVADGLAATVDGDYFTVAGSGEVYAALYRNTAGSASLIGSFPSKAALDAQVSLIRAEAGGLPALAMVDADGFEGLRLTADFLRLVFGGADISGPANGAATTIATRDGASSIVLDQKGLAIAGLLLSALTGAEFSVGDEDGFLLLRVAPGETLLPGVIATPNAARIGPLRTVLDAQGRGAVADAKGEARLVPLEDGSVLIPGVSQIAYDDIPGVAIAFADPEGFWYGHITDDGAFSGSSGGNPGPDPEPVLGDLNPLFASDVYLLQDRPQYLSVPMLFAQRTDAKHVRATFSSGMLTVSGHDVLTLDPARCGDTGLLTIMRTDVPSNTRIQAPLNVHIGKPSGQSPKVLCIGDSITNRFALKRAEEILLELGVAPQWIGTINSSGNPAPGSTARWDATGPLCEAREGRAFADFVYSVIDGEATPLPDTPEDVAEYRAGTKQQKTQWNPFLRAATNDDPDEIVRNGYVFDPRFYLDRFDLPDPDIVYVNLLANDVAETSADQVGAVVADGAQIFIRQLRAALPNVPIGFFASGQGGGPLGDARWNPGKRNAIRALIKTVRAANDPLIKVVSSWAFMSPDDGWELSPTTPDPDTGLITGTVIDQLHPIGAARQQLSEQIASFIVCHS